MCDTASAAITLYFIAKSVLVSLVDFTLDMVAKRQIFLVVRCSRPSLRYVDFCRDWDFLSKLMNLSSSFRREFYGHDDVIKWKYSPRYWSFVREIHRWIPHTKAMTRSIDVSLICTWTNSWANNEDAGDLRRLRAHCDVIVMEISPRSRSRFLWMLLRGTKNYRWKSKPELQFICDNRIFNIKRILYHSFRERSQPGRHAFIV